MIIFSLYMFILILWFGGMAVDLMRFETTRAKLQACLDRATLAASDLDQTMPPADVVEDYFDKCGMSDFLEETIVDEGINYRQVSAVAAAEMPLLFYDLPKVLNTPFSPSLTTMTVRGGSTAREAVSDVEVSLVLDVSTSMTRNNRITNLRPAAREFVTTVLNNNTNAPNGLITISMVPYSAVVNVGPTIEPYLPNLERTHGFSTCPILLGDDETDLTLYETTELDLDGAYPIVGHFDPAWGSDRRAHPIEKPWCHRGEENAIVVASSNETILHNAINGLEPYGNTAIDLGMKWGVGLLDPSTRDLITGLAGQSGSPVPAAAAGRPQAHELDDVLKVIVLMTDGQNTNQYDLYDRFKTGMSYVWFDLQTPHQPIYEVDIEGISIQIDGLETPDDYSDDWFYISSRTPSERWKNHPAGFSNNRVYTNAMVNGPSHPAVFEEGVGPTYNGTVRHARWQELYANWRYDRVNNDLMARANNHGFLPWSAGEATASGPISGTYDFHLPDYTDSEYALNYYRASGYWGNRRLSALCEAARDQGIIIYTIAFEAPRGGQTALQDCASEPTAKHYFDVDGTDISAAFSAIASDIRSLKLIQ